MACPCGNTVADPDAALCIWCDTVKDEPAHAGHWSTFGTYWCDTCNSPYCDLL